MHACKLFGSSLIYFNLLLSIMAQCRVQSLKDEEAYTALIKAHLEDPRKTTQSWKCSDLDFVVGKHVEFLCGVAFTGCTINETILTKCMRDMFPGAQECKDMSKKLAEALSYCRAKKKPSSFSTGCKLDKAVMQVIDAIKTGSGDSQEQSPTPSLAASPAPSTPPRSEGDAAKALKKLQEAFGEEIASSGTAAASKGNAISLVDSPISIASSEDIFESPGPVPVATAPSSSSVVAKMPIQVSLVIGS